jgi:hypothetical protein
MLSRLVFATVLALTGVLQEKNVAAHPYQLGPIVDVGARFEQNKGAATDCFPAIGFTMPSTVPSSLTNWWCSTASEYAFVGFSYEVTACE